MARVNDHYLELKASYLFSDIAKRVQAFAAANPGARLIRLGIGDVTRPLPPAVIRALHDAADEMGRAETFKGYGPEQGYDFLPSRSPRTTTAREASRSRPTRSSSATARKCDTANIQEIFAPDNVVALTDPVYPVYVDTNVMAGRTRARPTQTGRYGRLVYLPCTADERLQPGAAEPRPSISSTCARRTTRPAPC